jgi:polynucleotide 5'-hydroxyl-kinase GRC3/NOL9
MGEEIFTLEGDERLLIIGPAKVKILSGDVEVFGRRMGEGEQFLVKKYRAMPLEVLEAPSKVSITPGVGGRAEDEGGRIGCSLWRNLSEMVLEDPRDLLILGRVDSGKSSLAVFLINRLLEKGLKVGVIDADPGQGDIGEPGLVGSSIAGNHILSLEELKPFKLAFIGSVSPMGLEERLEGAVSHLFQGLRSEGCSIILIVLHGWVMGERAHDHITRLITLLRVGTVISLGDEEVKMILDRLKGLEGHGLRIQYIQGAEPDTYKRSQEERRAIRDRKMRTYFSQIPFYIQGIRQGEIPIHGTKIFQGEMLSLKKDVKRWILEVTGMGKNSMIYSEGDGGRYRILAIDPESREPLQYWRETHQDTTLDIYAMGREIGLVTGFRDPYGSYWMGRLESLDPFKRRWSFLAPKGMGRAEEILLGRMVVDRDGTERRVLPRDFFS